MRRLLWLAVTGIGAGCTLLTQFDPEGQPCDTNAPRTSQCLSGYSCGPGQRCTKGPIADAGEAPSDGGSVVADAGSLIVDAGGPTPDAGGTTTDAGAMKPDAGSGADAGTAKDGG